MSAYTSPQLPADAETEELAGITPAERQLLRRLEAVEQALDRDGDGRADPPGAGPGARLAVTAAALVAAVSLAAGRWWGALEVYAAAPETARAELGPAVLAEVGAAGLHSLALVGLVVLVALGAEGLILRLLAARQGGTP